MTALDPVEVLSATLQRLHRLSRLRAAADKLYERVPDQRERVRASVVAVEVAKVVRREPSGWFRRELTEALRVAGWRRVSTHHLPEWCGVRRRAT